MKITIKRFDKKLPLPEYKTAGAAAFDLMARETTIISAGEVALVPLNIALKPAKGYFFLLAARSSLYKRGLMMANGIGIGDSDYCGENDEYKAALLNFTKKTVTVGKGERICQGLFLKIGRVQWQEVARMKEKSRGGFGSTGRK